MKTIIFILIAMASINSYSQLSLQSTSTIKKQITGKPVLYTNDIAVLFRVGNNGEILIGPKVNLELGSSKTVTRNIENVTFSNNFPAGYGYGWISQYKPNAELEYQHITKKTFKTKSRQVGIGLNVQKQLSLGKYDGILTLGAEGGVGAYRIKSTEENLGVTEIYSDEHNSIVFSGDFEKVIITKGKLLNVAVMASVNLSELINPNRNTDNTKTHLVGKIGVDRYSDKSYKHLYDIPSWEIGLRTEIGKSKRKAIYQ